MTPAKNRLPEWMPALRSWAARQPKLFLAAGAAALLLLGWALYVPTIEAIHRDVRRWSALRLEADRTRGVMDRIRHGEIRLLRSQETLPQLMEQLHAQARKYQIDIQAVAPARGDLDSTGRMFLLPVDFQMEGAYRAVGQFLGALHRDLSLGVVTVRQIQIGRDERLLPRLRVQLSLEIALKQEGSDGS